MTRRQLLMRALGLGGLALVPLRIDATSPDDWSVPLILSPEEAQALANVLCHVGGDCYKSPRGYIDRIARRLSYAGYKSQNWNVVTGGGIYFTNLDEVRDWRDGSRIVFPRGPDLAYRERFRASFTPDGKLR